MAREEKLNGLDLFAGIGGISLALKPWVRTVCYVEIDRYCQAVLQSRIAAGDLEDAPIWDDVTTFDPTPWAGAVDIISGGFPCQDISTAGKGAGLEGERSGLFFEIVRISSVIKPSFIFLENVPAILGRGGGTVISEIASLGYDTRWGILSAYDVGAPHQRDRWWCLAADTHSQPGPKQNQRSETWVEAPRRYDVARLCDPVAHAGSTERRPHTETGNQPNGNDAGGEKAPGGPGERSQDVAYTQCIGRKQVEPTVQGGTGGEGSASETPNGGIASRWAGWEFEPDVGRVANGVPLRVDRLKGLGNSVVPATAREAFKRLMGISMEAN